jgi:hypothetical protein
MTRMVQVPFGYVDIKALDLAERDALEAVRLDPQLAEARATLSMMHALHGRWVQSEQQMQLAFGLDNSNWQTFSRHSLVLATSGRLQDALKEARRAHEELAPLAMPAMVRHAIILATVGEDDKAMRLVDSALTMGGVTGVGEMPIMQAMAAFRAGRPAEAANHILILLPPTARGEEADRVVTEVFMAAAEGKQPARAQAAKDLRELIARLPVDARARSQAHMLMVLSTLVGDLDSAFASANRDLDYYASVQAVGPWWYPMWIPELAPFRRDARFIALVERMHLPDYWNAYGPPDVPGCEWRDRKLRCS